MGEFTKIVFAALLATGAIMTTSVIVYLAQSDDHSAQPMNSSASQVESEQSPVIVVTCPIAGNVAICTISKEDLNGKH